MGKAAHLNMLQISSWHGFYTLIDSIFYIKKISWSNLVHSKNLLILLTRLKKNWMVDKGKLQLGASFQDFVHQYFWRQGQLLHHLFD